MWLLELARSHYRKLLQAYLLCAFALLLLYALVPVGSLADRAGLIFAVLLGPVLMFWGGFAVLALQIRFQGHTQLVRFAAGFGFWFFSLATVVGLAQAFKGQPFWPFAILVPPATALGILRAWGKVKPRGQKVPPGTAVPITRS